MEASFSLGQDDIGWTRLQTTGETLSEKVVARQFTEANNAIWAGEDPVLDTSNTENDSEMKRQAEETTLQRLAKAHDILEMWQGSQLLWATQTKSRAQNTQITAKRYIPDTEEIVKAFWSLFQMMV